MTPMSCGDDLKTLLSRYVDGELPAEERARVDEHVAACVPCRDLLQLFQKNESLLSNALSTESFGNAVIEAVIDELKRDGVPADAKPVVEAPEVSRFRPLIPVAAAAVLLVGLVTLLNASHTKELAGLQEQLRAMAQTQQEQMTRLGQQQEEYTQSIRSMRTEDALRRAPEGWGLGYITPQHLVVRASFDPKLYGAFAVYRRVDGEGDDKFVKLNGGRLDSPEYIDASVKPGYAYVYKFRAYRGAAQESDFVESLPIIMRVPRIPEPTSEKGLRIQCVDIAVTHKLAKFVLSRTVDGRTLSEEFLAKPGERLGELRDLPGVGKVDFRTSLTLDRLSDGNQTLPVTYTRALLDPNGQPIIDSISKDGTVVVKTELQDGVLSIRPNLRAFFRMAGGSAGDVELWKGSWLQVRAQD
ncbi:MAG TPA: anti-sigma factor [Planctomycetota bacterium]|nr:anti-sigma factor [Planctomycetota bacterium]